MRADAEKHRELLVIAAERAFARLGPDAPLQEVIKESGLGRGTLYRHFPDRAALLVAVIGRQLDALMSYVAERADSPELLEDFLREQAFMGALFAPSIPLLEKLPASEVASLKRKAGKLRRAVVDAAIRHGDLDPSFTAEDLDFISRMLVGVAAGATTDSQKSVVRAVGIVLNGVRSR